MILPLFRCERGEAVGSAIARRGVAATREIGLLPWFCMQFPVYSCARRAHLGFAAAAPLVLAAGAGRGSPGFKRAGAAAGAGARARAHDGRVSEAWQGGTQRQGFCCV